MPECYTHLVSKKTECLRLLVAAGFSRSEVVEIQEHDQVTSVAMGIVASLQHPVIKPGIGFVWEMPEGDPFMALAAMDLDAKRALRDQSNYSFDEFIGGEAL